MSTSKRSLENELSLLSAYSESLQNVLKIEKELTQLRRKSENIINSFKSPSLLSQDDVHSIPSRSKKCLSNKIIAANNNVEDAPLYRPTPQNTSQLKTDTRNTDILNSKYIIKNKINEPSNKKSATAKSCGDNSLRLSLQPHNVVFAKERHKLHKYRNSLSTSESNISAAFEKITNSSLDDSQFFLDDSSNVSSETGSIFNIDKTGTEKFDFNLQNSVFDNDIEKLSIDLARQFNGLYTHIISQYVRDEKLLSKYFDVIRNFREKIALNTVKSELVRLKIKKNHAVDPNYSVKKKQRALLMKLQHEYNEIKFMRNYQKKLSNDRKRILYRQLKHFKTMFTLNIDRRDFGSKFYLRNVNLSALKENRQKSPLKCYHNSSSDENTVNKQNFQQKKFLNEHKRKLNDLLLLHFDLQLNSAALNSINHKYSNTEIINVLKEFSEKSKINKSKAADVATETAAAEQVESKNHNSIDNNRCIELMMIENDEIEKIDESHPSTSATTEIIPSIMKIGHVNMDKVSNSQYVQGISNKNKYLVQFHNHGDILDKFALKNRNLVLKIINGEGKLIQISFKNLTDRTENNNPTPTVKAISLNPIPNDSIIKNFKEYLTILNENVEKTSSENFTQTRCIEFALYDVISDILHKKIINRRLTEDVGNSVSPRKHKFNEFLTTCLDLIKFSNMNSQTIMNNFFENLIAHQKRIFIGEFTPTDVYVSHILNAACRVFRFIIVKHNPHSFADLLSNLECVTSGDRIINKITIYNKNVRNNKLTSANAETQNCNPSLPPTAVQRYELNANVVKSQNSSDKNSKLYTKSVPIIKSNSTENLLNHLREKHFENHVNDAADQRESLHHKDSLANAKVEMSKIKETLKEKIDTQNTFLNDSFIPERNLREKLVSGLVPAIAAKSLSQIEEAEELRKKQLAVELEIKSLLEQQKSQLSYFVVREIPDKPPPPYIPPSDDTKTSVGTSTEPIPFVETTVQQCEIADMVKLCHERIWLPFMAKTYPNHVEASSDFKKDCADAQQSTLHFSNDLFLFDLCNEQFINEYRDVNTKKNQWEYKRSLLQYKKNSVCKTVENLVKQNLGYGNTAPKDSMFINCAHKLQDHVDELLIRELQEEEPEWVNVEEYEVRLKNSLTEVILNSLVAETVKEFKSIYSNNK